MRLSELALFIQCEVRFVSGWGGGGQEGGGFYWTEKSSSLKNVKKIERG